jgi:hypothetical protein
MSVVPSPAAAWPLDGTSYGASSAKLHGSCNWTAGHALHTSALLLGAACHASAVHTTSLQFGTSSFSACARFRTRSVREGVSNSKNSHAYEYNVVLPPLPQHDTPHPAFLCMSFFSAEHSCSTSSAASHLAASASRSQRAVEASVSRLQIARESRSMKSSAEHCLPTVSGIMRASCCSEGHIRS